MKEYMKMSDEFKAGDMPMLVELIAAIKVVGMNKALSIMHAINCHDELVSEVERLRGMVQDAFIDGCHTGWDMTGEGYNAEYGGPDDGAMHDMFVTKSMKYNKGA